MATKTTINLDDESAAALDELVGVDGTKTLAIKRALLAQAERRRRTRALLDSITAWEAVEGPIDPVHLAWADAVLDRQGVPR
jgi:predicted transcriptional regulator